LTLPWLQFHVEFITSSTPGEWNYPNPFNPITKIMLSIPNAQKVKIEIFSVLGHKIATVANRKLSAGFRFLYLLPFLRNLYRKGHRSAARWPLCCTLNFKNHRSKFIFLTSEKVVVLS
jgi:hypothetical protein